MRKLFPSLVSVAAVNFLLPAAVFATSVDHDFQWWQPVFLDAPIVNKKVRGYFEVNPRLNDNLKGMRQLIIRPGIGYQFNRSVSGYVGYAWINNFQPHRQEHRVWQQLGYGKVLFGRLQTLNRLRLEERLIEYTNGECAVRGRYMLRLAIPLKGRWYAVASDELFVNFNSVENGPTAGIDQNRIYAALGRQVNSKLRLETGYQHQYINRPDATADTAGHVLMTQMFISL